MENITLKELAVPLIKSIDSFNYLLKSHHRRTAIISYYLGNEMGLNQKEMINLVISASMHDIGALSVQERDMLIQEDVENPKPHCDMGFKMLSDFDIFKDIAHIIKHHHIKYSELAETEDSVCIQSHIIHLADRIDILLAPDEFILNQKEKVSQKILEKEEMIFHPIVCRAFERISKNNLFWIEIENMTLEELFSKVDFNVYNSLNREQIIDFALVISRIIDFRSRFTACHSYTVGQIAYKIGKLLILTKIAVPNFLLQDISMILEK